MAAAPTRRSPDLAGPWEAADPPGLPSIHGGFMALSELGRPDLGSRAPSRLAAGTPTPRDEESLEARPSAGGRVTPWAMPHAPPHGPPHEAPWAAAAERDRGPRSNEVVPRTGHVNIGLSRRPDLGTYH